MSDKLNPRLREEFESLPIALKNRILEITTQRIETSEQLRQLAELAKTQGRHIEFF